MKFIRTLVLLFLLSFGATLLIVREPMTGSEHASSSQIEIASGESLRDIASHLRRKGIIRSSSAFRIYMRYKGLDTAIQPGTVLLSRSMSYAEIAEMLTGKGERTQLKITIPEGYTVMQIDALLAQSSLIEPGELIDCSQSCDFPSFEFLPDSASVVRPGNRLEGYLFPDTYFVDSSDFVVKFFIERMLGTFRKNVLSNLSMDIDVSGRSIRDIVIMASLIERETKTAEERPIVAGILWKRLDSGRGLDVDATVRYALSKPTAAITKNDLQSDSHYNTRRFAGLPPGPIANPGLSSIQSALHPTDSPYWYYLHGRDGEIRYSETNDEHNAKKAKYL